MKFFYSENFRKNFEKILCSDIIKCYYDIYDFIKDSDGKKKSTYEIPKFLETCGERDDKYPLLWDRIKFLELFKTTSGMTTHHLMIYLNDLFPGEIVSGKLDEESIIIILEGILIYILIHESNHFNRFLQFIEQNISKSNTPRDDSFQNITRPEGGKYLCERLFGDNHELLTIEQANFLRNIENWNDKFNDPVVSEKEIKELIIRREITLQDYPNIEIKGLDIFNLNEIYILENIQKFQIEESSLSNIHLNRFLFGRIKIQRFRNEFARITNNFIITGIDFAKMKTNEENKRYFKFECERLLKD